MPKPKVPVQNTLAPVQQSYLWWFALLACLLAAMVWQESLRRPMREIITYPTALADKRYLPALHAEVGAEFEIVLGQTIKTPMVATQARCRVLELLTAGQSPKPAAVEKVGWDAKQRFSLYQSPSGLFYVQYAPLRFAQVEILPSPSAY